MNITQTEKDSVLIGSGYLYALEAEDFTDDTDIDEMVEALAIHDRELKLSAGMDEE